MLGLVPVGSAPLGVVSLDSRLTWVNGDLQNTGWTASAGSFLYDMIDEAVADNSDYIYTNPSTGTNTAVFSLQNAIPAGTYDININISKQSITGNIRLSLGDSSSYKGSSNWIPITSNTFTLYTVSITTSGTCDRVKIEATI